MSLLRVERNKHMNTLSNIPQLAFFFAAALLTCSHADATTVTYNFDETGWINTAGTTENFSGSFTGTLETSGVLALSDLTAFTNNRHRDQRPERHQAHRYIRTRHWKQCLVEFPA